jgi:hypothetical protein
MTTDTDRIDNIWKGKVLPVYGAMERHRLYAITPDSRRFMAWLWRSCAELEPENPAKPFKWALETLADECDVNVLQPLPPNELKAPERWRDLWGKPLPNPFATDDLKGQSLVTQRDAPLAEWLKKFAESPYQAAVEWQDRQAALLAQKAIKYDRDSHVANVFCNGSEETTKGRFIRDSDKATVERHRWEARPIEFPTGKSFNLTAQGKISRNPKLNGLISAANNYEREWREGARAKARQDIEAAQKNLKELEAAAQR